MSLGKRLRRFVRRVLRPDSGRRSVEHEGTKLGRDVSDVFGPAEGGVDGGVGSGGGACPGSGAAAGLASARSSPVTSPLSATRPRLSEKMLCLSFLLLVGVALIADGLHFHIPKGYLYFAIAWSEWPCHWSDTLWMNGSEPSGATSHEQGDGCVWNLIWRTLPISSFYFLCF